MTSSATKADDHAEDTGHHMDVQGTVIPLKRKLKISKSKFRAPSPDYVPPKGMREDQR